MTHGIKVAWTAVVAMAAGCAVYWDVETYAVPGAEVALRETWAWKGGDFGGAPQIEPAAIAAAESLARAAVTEELARKGYREAATAEAADLVASYRVSGMQRFVDEETPRIGAPSPAVLTPSEIQPPPASSVPREVAVREGSVILFLDDPRLGKLAWRGEVAEQIRAGSPEQAGRMIAQMLREIAKEVPARTGR